MTRIGYVPSSIHRKPDVMLIMLLRYVFSDALIQKYGGIEGVTEEAVLAEAKAAMKPFELEFLGEKSFSG